MKELQITNYELRNADKSQRCRFCVFAFLLAYCAAAAGQEGADALEQSKQEEELGKRLIRKAVTDSDEDLMESILRLMKEVSRKLEIEFDAGQPTQTLQTQIVDKLDTAIRIAAAQRRPASQGQQSATGDKRRRGGRAGSASGKPGRSSGEETNGSSTSAAKAGNNSSNPGRDDDALRQSRRSWGHLPRRERDEIIQGVREGFLERYRDWIERYYRALQAQDE